MCNSLLNNGGVDDWHDEHMVPYGYEDDIWMGYDNARSLENKVLVYVPALNKIRTGRFNVRVDLCRNLHSELHGHPVPERSPYQVECGRIVEDEGVGVQVACMMSELVLVCR